MSVQKPDVETLLGDSWTMGTILGEVSSLLERMHEL